MKVIGLTGGIGSGKSTVLCEFRNLGADIISCDEISHRIMKRGESAYNEVVAEFGNGILNAENEIDRRKLASIVFADGKKLEVLNGITHRLIYEDIKRQISESGAELVCVEIPLLFNSECPLELAAKIAVLADKEVRISRVMKRDNSTRDEVEARIRKQLSDSEMREKADYIIENNDNIDYLQHQVEKIYKVFV